MIVSFGDIATEDLYHGRTTGRTRRIPDELVDAALRKLDMLNAAADLGDLRSPPGNRWEALKGDRSGFSSIRVNDRWRIVFRWQSRNAFDVRLTDYH